jgi:hypothetical protein
MVDITAQTGKDVKPPGSRLPEFKQTAYNTLRFSLTLVEKIAGCFPVPGVKDAIGSLNLVIDRFDVGGSCLVNQNPIYMALFQKTGQNATEMEALLKSFDSLDGILQSFYKTKSPLGNDMTEDMKRQIAGLSA